MKKTLLILLASSLLFSFGCDKKGESASSAAQLGGEVVSGPWDKSAVNGFLSYIPADSAMVYASTRAIDLDTPHIKDYLAKAAKVLRDKKDAEALSDGSEGRGSMQFYDELIDLMANYERLAPQWGLDSKGQTDFVMYMTDTKVVAKLSLADGEKAKAKVSEILKGFREMLVTELEVGDKNWILVSDTDSETPSIGLHFGARELTVGLLFDVTKDVDDLNDLLKPAGKPMKKNGLGQLDDKTAVIGFIDNVKVLQRVLDPKSDLSKFLGPNAAKAVSDLCKDEMMAIAEGFPRIAFDASIDGADIRMNSVLKITNDDTLDDLKSVLGDRSAIETPNNIGELFVSVDVNESFNVLAKWGSSIMKSPYKCGDLRLINSFGRVMSGLPKSEIKDYFEFTRSMTGFGVSIESIEVVDDVRKLSFSGYMLGSEFIHTMDFSGYRSEELLKMVLEKDQVSTLDFSRELRMPLIVHTLFKDKGLFVTTGEGQAVSQLAQSKVSAAKEFFSLKFNDSVLSLVGDIRDRRKSYYSAPTDLTLKMDYSFNVKLSLVDDGLKLSGLGHF